MANRATVCNIVQRDISDSNVIRRRDTYAYDYLNQLKKVDVPGDKDLEYGYDQHFNRLFMNHGFGVVTYNYNYDLNTLTEWKEDTDGDGVYELKIGYAYNTQGNPTYKKYMDARLSDKELARETFSWNNRDQLTSIRGRVTENYVYDYEGLRLQRSVTKPSTPSNTVSTYTYAYLQNNQPAFKYNVSENTFDVFVYEGSKRIMRVRVSSMGTAIKEYFINDYQGSPVAVVDDSQTIKYQNYNDPFGNMEMAIGVPSSNPEFKYTDKELDEDSGLYYFQARYMDPIAGRFVGRDKIKLEDKTVNYFHVNTYQYCNNNPVNIIDADGNAEIKDYYTKFTPEETNLYRNIGVSKLEVAFLANNACETAIQVGREQGWNPNEVRNGRTDAFRHAYFSANLANKFGEKKAMQIVSAHEKYATPAGYENESAMDAYNNLQGIKLGTSIAQGDIPQPNATVLDLKSSVTNMVNTGQLNAFSDYDNYRFAQPSTQLVKTNEIK